MTQKRFQRKYGRFVQSKLQTHFQYYCWFLMIGTFSLNSLLFNAACTLRARPPFLLHHSYRAGVGNSTSQFTAFTPETMFASDQNLPQYLSLLILNLAITVWTYVFNSIILPDYSNFLCRFMVSDHVLGVCELERKKTSSFKIRDEVLGSY